MSLANKVFNLLDAYKKLEEENNQLKKDLAKLKNELSYMRKRLKATTKC